MRYIDICVNLDNSQFDKDRNEMLARANDAGVSGILITATNLESTRPSPDRGCPSTLRRALEWTNGEPWR